MKKVILGFLFIATPLWAGSGVEEFYQMQASDALRDIAEAQKDMAFQQMFLNDEPRIVYKTEQVPYPVYINEAGEGCHYEKWIGNNGKAHWYQCDDGKLHQVFVRVCDTDVRY